MFSGFTQSSLNEWDGYISSIVWTQGCNLRCPYCHNSSLIPDGAVAGTISEDDILAYLKEDKWIDGLCITGGEPTIHAKLPFFIHKVLYSTWKKIKLQTNGTNPTMIKNLLDGGLLDCLSIDFKHRLDKTIDGVIGVKGFLDSVTKSIELSLQTNIEVEYHTVLCPHNIGFDDILAIGEKLNGKGKWFLQQYSPENVLDVEKAGDYIYSEDEIHELACLAESLHPNVICNV